MVIAPSFGAIFASNCVQNQIVPVVLPDDRIAEIAELIAARPGGIQLMVRSSTGSRWTSRRSVVPVRAEPAAADLARDAPIRVDLIRNDADAIADFQGRDRLRRPWAYLGITTTRETRVTSQAAVARAIEGPEGS